MYGQDSEQGYDAKGYAKATAGVTTAQKAAWTSDMAASRKQKWSEKIVLEMSEDDASNLLMQARTGLQNPWAESAHTQQSKRVLSALVDVLHRAGVR